ncbi:uncharacterized protein LOC116683349 [Etheostoma spectabile]|uniref:uncharacterized protein LOC116683349 n=1 Tax=Etheostoma spectabile TaxID=54343 RepID=UPI0013AF0B96|nr:uncharacterized protein LOC116683349 [Etheostoma spectabile]
MLRECECDGWTVVGQGRKITQQADIEDSYVAANIKRDYGLKECSVLSNPVWFNQELLDVLGDGRIHLPPALIKAIPKGQKKTTTKLRERPNGCRKRKLYQQEEATPLVDLVSPSPARVAVEEVNPHSSNPSLKDTREDHAVKLQERTPVSQRTEDVHQMPSNKRCKMAQHEDSKDAPSVVIATSLFFLSVLTPLSIILHTASAIFVASGFETAFTPTKINFDFPLTATPDVDHFFFHHCTVEGSI